MTWTKLSDDFSDDCDQLSSDAFRLHVEAERKIRSVLGVSKVAYVAPLGRGRAGAQTDSEQSRRGYRHVSHHLVLPYCSDETVPEMVDRAVCHGMGAGMIPALYLNRPLACRRMLK